MYGYICYFHIKININILPPPHLYVLELGMRGLVGMDLDIQEDNEGVIRVTTGDSRKGRLGVIFVFSVCIHVCIFGGDEIECYLSIQVSMLIFILI